MDRTLRRAEPVDAVFLDVGGVLLLPDARIVASVLAGVGITVDAGTLERAHYAGAAALDEWPETSDGTHRDHAVFDRFRRGYLSAVEAADGSPEFGERSAGALDALADAFARDDMWTMPAPGAREGLEELAGTNAIVAVVSNATGEAARILEEQGLCQVGPGAAVEVAAVVDSHLVGVAKPDPRIFEIALDAVGTSPDRALHVGDIVGADVRGAEAAGVHPVHFDPHRLCPYDDHDHARALSEVAHAVRALESQA